MDIGFWILAIICVIAALAVVVLRNVFRAALALILCFLTVAGLYILLSAEFLAVIQILIYVGAISIIIILAIMMTREYQQGSPSNKFRIPAFVVAVIFLGVVLYSVLSTTWNISNTAPAAANTQVLAGQLFGAGGYVLPLEIAGVLLLAAVIGAIILLRDKK
ncbi:MAG: NADH-quinone oxidoreductase subunit J [Dehalococcoidales bacterium]|nr:NADH-quinone oxidoreductase subunit J [Dehalococcoidales bacterium]